MGFIVKNNDNMTTRVTYLSKLKCVKKKYDLIFSVLIIFYV